jgi:hypothetical protein
MYKSLSQKIQIKLLRIQLALSGRVGCPPHNHLEKILVQIKGATAYLQL